MPSLKKTYSLNLSHQLMADKYFETPMDRNGLAAWHAFRGVCSGVLGKHPECQCKRFVDDLIRSYQVNMPLKQHFLHSHRSFFPENADVSDEDREKFHQDIAMMVNRYKGKWSCAMLADFCWNLKCDQT